MKSITKEIGLKAIMSIIITTILLPIFAPTLYVLAENQETEDQKTEKHDYFTSLVLKEESEKR
ncbi:MAG: hypothetical protein HUJ68_00285 [Clostridia bacterium]|nr:hypothetical protein [Clostridia bacterium]